MKVFLVWKLLSLPFIIRYCAAASDPNPNRLLPDSETTSTSSISLPEEISQANPISAITITTEQPTFSFSGGEIIPPQITLLLTLEKKAQNFTAKARRILAYQMKKPKLLVAGDD